MIPASDLKICSVAFAVFWTALVLWWSESFDCVTVMIAVLCGSLAGYGGYRAMRRQPPRGTAASRRSDHSIPAIRHHDRTRDIA
jgi:hypothetical protein